MPRRPRSQSDPLRPRADGDVKIIGGEFRGRKLVYHGDPVTRPMKHRVREAIFNLIGVDAQGRHAWDLFAGTGALGLEALSRGAARATFVERHLPTARQVRENIEALGVADRTELVTTNTLLWAKRDLPLADRSLPWLVFISPPYALFVDDAPAMEGLIAAVIDRAPPSSVLVVESDCRYDMGPLTAAAPTDWDQREYPPARIAIFRTPGA